MTPDRTPRQFCGRTRREFLWETGAGFGALGLTGLLSNDGFFHRASAAEGSKVTTKFVRSHLPSMARKSYAGCQVPDRRWSRTMSGP